MKRGRGGDSIEALRAIWMEGYERGRTDERRIWVATGPNAPRVPAEPQPYDLPSIEVRARGVAAGQ